ncbi:DeoR/GlpR family DNA-binding transcription regulator [Cuneatibacter caecimuris]|uniref:DeoR family transcriptional regulator n=1 Tax=Cuneatibacter caecimuris TaxID=1796618 RepID=A0A4Q7PMQ3_9FIRM|nr:DeoR/GlpR family DNA-binding transcription regulator [Cuneatibacter caecimuris]RZT02033.1 DeoR family transcriptional regulator [Cuneatibacter caecimuris]
MLAIERRNMILESLQRDGRVVVSELSQHYGVSEETIRRDLDRLEKDGFAIKTYGGAVINENNNVDLPFTIRKNANIAAKQKIAELLAEQIHDGDHIMLDASSTAVFVARSIKNKKNITLITNSVEILVELADVVGWRIFSTGGSLREGSLALVGPQAERMLASFHVDMAVISCKGIDEIRGFSESNEMHAQTKKCMLESAFQKVLAIDSTKFDKISFTQIGSLKDLTAVVTDKEPEERWKQIFTAAGVSCRYPEGVVEKEEE